MFNIFMVVFFATLAFAFFDEYFFIGYLISIAFFGLFQASSWPTPAAPGTTPRRSSRPSCKAKGTPLHDACVVGDTVGDPFKDTSSVAMNPIIKFTTLFGLLAVELALQMTAAHQGALRLVLSAVFLAVMLVLRLPVVLRDAHRVGRRGQPDVTRGAPTLRRSRGRCWPRPAPPSRSSRCRAWCCCPAPRRPSTSSSRATARSSRRRSTGDRVVAVPDPGRPGRGHGGARPRCCPVAGALRDRRRAAERRRHPRRAAPLRRAGARCWRSWTRGTTLPRSSAPSWWRTSTRRAAPGALQGDVEALAQLCYELIPLLPPESGVGRLTEAVARMKDPAAMADLVAAAAITEPAARYRVLAEPSVARRLELVDEELASLVLLLSRGARRGAEAARPATARRPTRRARCRGR